jgi:hypothetical protein
MGSGNQRGGSVMKEELLEPYCRFLTLLGHKVIRTSDTVWFEVRPRIFQPAAAFRTQTVTGPELADLFRHRSVLGCRWFSDRQPNPGASTHDGPVVYNAKPPYDLSSLSQKARNQTRRALERISVRRAALDDQLKAQCHLIYADNLKRLGLLQGKGETEKKWMRWVAAIGSGDHVDLWTGWHKSELVTFAVTVNTPWGAEIVLQRSAGSAHSLYPNNALVYTMVSDSFERGFTDISFGLSAYSAKNNGLEHFKQGMGFESRQLEEHYSWTPLVRPLASRLTPTRLRSLYRFVSRTNS